MCFTVENTCWQQIHNARTSLATPYAMQNPFWVVPVAQSPFAPTSAAMTVPYQLALHSSLPHRDGDGCVLSAGDVSIRPCRAYDTKMAAYLRGYSTVYTQQNTSDSVRLILVRDCCFDASEMTPAASAAVKNTSAAPVRHDFRSVDDFSAAYALHQRDSFLADTADESVHLVVIGGCALVSKVGARSRNYHRTLDQPIVGAHGRLLLWCARVTRQQQDHCKRHVIEPLADFMVGSGAAPVACTTRATGSCLGCLREPHLSELLRKAKAQKKGIWALEESASISAPSDTRHRQRASSRATLPAPPATPQRASPSAVVRAPPDTCQNASSSAASPDPTVPAPSDTSGAAPSSAARRPTVGSAAVASSSSNSRTLADSAPGAQAATGGTPGTTHSSPSAPPLVPSGTPSQAARSVRPQRSNAKTKSTPKVSDRRQQKRKSTQSPVRSSKTTTAPNRRKVNARTEPQRTLNHPPRKTMSDYFPTPGKRRLTAHTTPTDAPKCKKGVAVHRKRHKGLPRQRTSATPNQPTRNRRKK